MAASKRQLVGGGARDDVGVVDSAAGAFETAVEGVARSAQKIVHLLAIGIAAAESHATGKTTVRPGLPRFVTGLDAAAPVAPMPAVLPPGPHPLADRPDEPG